MSSDRCVCGHSIASHEQWGTGYCDALTCSCQEFTAPVVVRCRCSHIESWHYTDAKGRPVCGSSACGCIKWRPEVSA